MKELLGIMLQGGFLLMLSPLVNGMIRKAKARMQQRVGPPLLQSYWDIFKFLRREKLTSVNTSWVTTITPYIYLSAILVAGGMIPLWGGKSLGLTDVILFIYLFALARFFLALAALEPASAFAGMGASREMMINSLVEPVLVLGLFGMVAFTGSTDLGNLVGAGQNIAGVLAFIGLMLVTLAETGRVPVDNPDTHLELTMVHEGMLLEYSGGQVALLHCGAMLKQTILLVLLVHIFFPSLTSSISLFGITMLAKVMLLSLLLALIETMNAKMRLFRIPELMASGAMFCIMSIIIKSF